MLRNPRVWLYASGFWLVFAGLAHTGAHVWTYVLERGMLGQREFAMNAMKQALSHDPLTPSLWTQFRMFSASFSVFLMSWGSLGVTLAWMAAPARVLRAYALLGTITWTAAFGVYVFVDPVIQAIAASAVAVPLHALAWLTADREAGSAD